MNVDDDNELVLAVVNGSVSSFEVLVERYQKTIYTMVLRMVGSAENAKDITQDIFVKAYVNMGTFNPKYRFFSWFYRLALNEVITWIRRNPVMVRLEDAHLNTLTDKETSEDESRMKILQDSLLRLDPDYRALLFLKYHCACSYEEMAEITGVSVKKVRSRLFISREQLRKVLLKKGFQNHE